MTLTASALTEINTRVFASNYEAIAHGNAARMFKHPTGGSNNNQLHSESTLDIATGRLAIVGYTTSTGDNNHPINCIVATKDSRIAAVGDSSGKTVVYDLTAVPKPRVLTILKETSSISALCFSDDEKNTVTNTSSSSSSSAPTAASGGGSSSSSSSATPSSPTSSLFLAVAFSGSIKVFDTRIWQPVVSISLENCHENPITSIDFCMKRRELISASNSCIKVHDLDQGGAAKKTFNDFHAKGANISCVRYKNRKAGSDIAASSGGDDKDTKIVFFSVESGEKKFEVTDHKDPISSFNFSSDAKKICTACKDNTSRIFDVSSEDKSGSALQIWKGQHSRFVLDACFSPDDKICCCITDAKKIFLYDVETGEQVGEAFGTGLHVLNSVCWTKNAGAILVGGADKHLRQFLLRGACVGAIALGSGGDVQKLEASPNNAFVKASNKEASDVLLALALQDEDFEVEAAANLKCAACGKVWEKCPENYECDCKLKDRQKLWQPDSEASACPVCKTGFGLFTRRHHCRGQACGAKVFCKDCCRFECYVAGWPEKLGKQRVCLEDLAQAKIKKKKKEN